MRNLELFRKLIPFRAYVKPCPGGILVSTGRGFAQADTVFRSDAELNDVQPNLAGGLRAYGEKTPVFLSNDARRVLAILMADMFVTDENNENICICYVDFAEVSDEHLCINGTAFPYIEGADPLTHEVMLVPSTIDPGTIRITKVWLDAHRPGWQQRFDISTELNIHLTECIRSVLEKSNKLLPESLPGNFCE